MAAASLGLHRKRKHGYTPERKQRRHRERRPAGRRPSSLRADLHRAFLVLGTLVTAAGDPVCGEVLSARSRTFTDALADLAARDPRIERWLRALGRGGPYAAVLLGAAEIMIPIAAHHGLLAPGIAGLLAGGPVERSSGEPLRPAGSTPEAAEGIAGG